MADVESSNIVGYTNDMSVNRGFTVAGGAFFNVGEDVLTIKDRLTANNASDGGLELWVVDQYLAVANKAYWFNAYEDLPAGWFDENGEEEVNADIAKGTGVLLNNGDTGVTLGQSGEVIVGDVDAVPVNRGFTVFVNPFAVTLPLENIAAVNASDGGLEVWIVDQYLAVAKKAYWFNAYEDLPAGWFDENGEEEVTGVSLDAGKGVLVNNGDAGVMFSITSPVTK